MKLVSVIMPYYKKRNYINKSINSVLRQTYQKFEIIIVYDDEDLKDVNFIKSIKKKDKRILVIYNSKNYGAGISRNVAINLAKGYFISFLDCDDIWKKNKLELQVKFMNKNKLDFSHTSYNLINSKDKKIGTRLAKPVLSYEDLLKSCDIGLSTVMCKKKIFNNYCKFPNLKTKEDYVLWLKLAQKKIVLRGLNIILTQWRVVNNSLSANSIQKIFDAFSVYNKYMKFNFFKTCQCVFILSLNYIIKKYL
jgi:teichuronic acid biosynthesis glycosyltransferase TuaG